MEIVVGGLVIGVVLAIGWVFVLFIAASMGIPLERRKTRETRMALAAQLQENEIRAEAERQLRVEEMKARLRDQ